MSFWRTFGFHAVSAIDSLLEQSDVTLEQLLEEDDLLQETKSQNKKLIDFLCQPETLQKLIRYITVKTEHEDDPKLAIKYPFLACEVLASEVWSIYDAIANDGKLMEMLYSIFEKDPPLDIQLSAYAARVAVILLQKKVTETVTFLKEKKEIVEHFLKHLGNPAVMDLLLKLISCEDPQTGNSGALEWLQKTNLIKSLVSKFKSTNTPETHENVAHTLVEIIKIGPNAAPLIEQLEGKTILEELFSYMKENKNGSEMSYGVNVLMTLVMRHSKDVYTESVSPDQMSEPLSVILADTDAFSKYLNSPNEKSDKETDKPVVASESKQEKPEDAPESKTEAQDIKPGKEEVKETPLPASVLNFVGKKKLKSSVGEIEPVGFCRLKLVEFFSCLARTNIQLVDKILADKGIFKKCIELFFAHPWNNFLHASVESMIRGALESPNEDLKTHILKDCALLDRIVANNKLNTEICSKPKGMRLGNMGHITALVFVISEMGQHSPAIEKFVSEHADWNAYSKAIMETSVNVNNSFGFTQELANEENMDDMSGQYNPTPSFAHFQPFAMNTDFSADNDTEDDPNAMDNEYEPNNKFEHGMFAQFKANPEDSDDSEESEDEDGDGVVVTQTETLEDEDDIVTEVVDEQPMQKSPDQSSSPEKDPSPAPTTEEHHEQKEPEPEPQPNQESTDPKPASTDA